MSSIKKHLNTLAAELRLAKLNFKQRQQAFSAKKEIIIGKIYSSPTKEFYSALSKQEKLKNEFRHKHIARALLKGKEYKRIENKCRPGNYPDDGDVNRYIEEFCAQMGQDTYPVYARNYLGDDVFTLEKVDEKAVHPNLKAKAS